MDLKQELRRLVPTGALGLLGFDGSVEPLGGADQTVLFTDVDGYTEVTERLGDATSRRLVRAHDRIVRTAVAEVGGREIKHTGDGIMATFPSAARAVHAACRIQKDARAWNATPQRPAVLAIAIGINSGAPLEEAGDLFGSAVNVASRITGAAAGGQILAADVVRQLAAGKGFVFRHLGARELEGLTDPVPLFEVVWQEEVERAGERAA